MKAKTLIFVFVILCSLYSLSCKENTNTKMPDGGYQQRSDSTAYADSLSKDTKDGGAVAVDTVKNGQAVISGATGADSAK